jgi:hypothetical protein
MLLDAHLNTLSLAPQNDAHDIFIGDEDYTNYIRILAMMNMPCTIGSLIL